MLKDKYLAADGIENVIKVLEEIEDEKLSDLDFIELNACPGGCVGGPLTVENPYVAKARIQHLRKYMPVSCNHLEIKAVPRYMRWDNPLKELPVMRLSDDMGEALQKMGEMKKIESSLPGLDCGTCGAPSCSDLAEDIVRGKASIEDCVFFSRENTDKNNYIPIPAPFRKTEKNE